MAGITPKRARIALRSLSSDRINMLLNKKINKYINKHKESSKHKTVQMAEWYRVSVS